MRIWKTEANSLFYAILRSPARLDHIARCGGNDRTDSIMIGLKNISRATCGITQAIIVAHSTINDYLDSHLLESDGRFSCIPSSGGVIQELQQKERTGQATQKDSLLQLKERYL
ncbi:hypothetical protein [Nitrosomonas oligotropha]|uniref:hypothetical protein n=1 Tax=Nitrosomonas oligotropha TaxID=42354 RepID=UPI0013698042|nr:hypothetical protein [Nitrosomonas oligotropha]MXS83657.1 hypothetical protein [Nitrosomonas oligotropha]